MKGETSSVSNRVIGSPLYFMLSEISVGYSFRVGWLSYCWTVVSMDDELYSKDSALFSNMENI